MKIIKFSTLSLLLKDLPFKLPVMDYEENFVKALQCKCLCLVNPNPISENSSRFGKEEKETSLIHNRR